MNKTNIIIIEDDEQIRNFINYALTQENFNTVTASTAQEGLSKIVTGHIDLVILDLGLPDFDGMEVIKKIREWSEIPIIVVSARDFENEKALALDSGADDYITKPFSTTELLARIRVALRHLYRENTSNNSAIAKVGDLSIDFSKHQVYLKNEEIHLTPLEYDLLSLLFKNIGKVLTTKYIIKEVYGISYTTDTQALRSLMAGLRRKIEPTPAKPRYIITEISVGYRLVDQ